MKREMILLDHGTGESRIVQALTAQRKKEIQRRALEMFLLERHLEDHPHTLAESVGKRLGLGSESPERRQAEQFAEVLNRGGPPPA